MGEYEGIWPIIELGGCLCWTLHRAWEVLILLKTGIDGVSGLSFAYSAAEAPAQTTVGRSATQIARSQQISTYISYSSRITFHSMNTTGVDQETQYQVIFSYFTSLGKSSEIIGK